MMGALLLPVLSPLTACSPKRPLELTYEITGTRAERVSAVSRILATHKPLPGALLDAYFVEQQTGDGYLGPSDFVSFCVLTVAAADLPAWRAAMSPIEPQNSPPNHEVPKKEVPWWLSPAEFKALEFYSPSTFGGRANGWIGIQSETGRIFVFTFTM